MLKASKLVGAALSVASLAMLGCDDSTDIDFTAFTASLTAGAVVPPVAGATATGVAAITLGQNNILRARIRIDGDLTSGVTGAHIHGPASTSGTADIIVSFDESMAAVIAAGATTGLIVEAAIDLNALAVDPAGVLRVTPAELLAMLSNGTAYVDVTTVANPDGEIRGQVERR